MLDKNGVNANVIMGNAIKNVANIIEELKLISLPENNSRVKE